MLRSFLTHCSWRRALSCTFVHCEKSDFWFVKSTEAKLKVKECNVLFSEILFCIIFAKEIIFVLSSIMVLVCNITFLKSNMTFVKSIIHIIEWMCYELLYTHVVVLVKIGRVLFTYYMYFLHCCLLTGLGFLHCNFYILRLEGNHFGPKSILPCTNRKWGFLQCCMRWENRAPCEFKKPCKCQKPRQINSVEGRRENSLPSELRSRVYVIALFVL